MGRGPKRGSGRGAQTPRSGATSNTAGTNHPDTASPAVELGARDRWLRYHADDLRQKGVAADAIARPGMKSPRPLMIATSDAVSADFSTGIASPEDFHGYLTTLVPSKSVCLRIFSPGRTQAVSGLDVFQRRRFVRHPESGRLSLAQARTEAPTFDQAQLQHLPRRQIGDDRSGLQK